MTTIKITGVCQTGSIVLSPEFAEWLRVQKGDDVSVETTKDGIELRKKVLATGEQTKLARQIVAEDDQVLQKLADL